MPSAFLRWRFGLLPWSQRCGKNGVAATARFSGSGRADGADQLFTANGYLRFHFLRLRFRSIRKSRRENGDADCACHLSISDIDERIVAKVFQLRSDGMDLATTDISPTVKFTARL
jgi:hypothetical protein